MCSIQDKLSCNTRVTLPVICYHHSNSSIGNLFGIPLSSCSLACTRWLTGHTRAHADDSEWQAVPLVEKRMSVKKGNKRQIELWFPLQAMSHKHEGVSQKKKKRLFWDGYYSNIISKGAGTCRDVSIAMPCVCVWINITCPKSSLLCSKELCPTFLHKVL